MTQLYLLAKHIVEPSTSISFVNVALYIVSSFGHRLLFRVLAGIQPSIFV
jgi:hypothetical protein